MTKRLLSALNHIDASLLDYQTWMNVGMALKQEGYDWCVWDEWSRKDMTRYHQGECKRKWETFQGSTTPITGASIVKLAQDSGWQPFQGEEGCMDWDDVISYDGEGYPCEAVPIRKPTEDLILYLQTLFDIDDHVGYVTGDTWKTEDGKWVPSKGVYDRTAGDLIDSLRKYPDDLGATVGDWKAEAGAWIRFNALDGEGVRNENCTSFRFALVESDSMPIDEQISMVRKLELPIAALVSSAGKSVHAIVRVDANDAQEYKRRVSFLYDFLASRGLKVDTQNRNPSRLTRMPGVTRNGVQQKLLGTNMGRRSWVDWMDFVEGATDELPQLEKLSDLTIAPPPLPDELIEGVLRRGHKMLISGSSKAGKSFLLMELAIAISEGTPWLGFNCKRGRVLYVNLEIDRASCIHRFLKIYEALDATPEHADNLIVWNLRGKAVPLDQLVPKLIRRVRDLSLDAIIIDPIYKVITGDENSASDMAAFCNQFDRICNETGCSTIYCHHHSKGAQGAKKAMDRASGSGVFARDPDAQLDMIGLELSEDIRNNVASHGATAWRLESSLREFKNFVPVDFWFEYPIHKLDISSSLEEMPPQGTSAAGRIKNSRHKTNKTAADEFRTAYDLGNMDGNGVSVKDIATYLGLAERTVRERVSKMEGEFILKSGIIHKSQIPSTSEINSQLMP